MDKAVVLVSGGMDSVTLLHDVCRRRGAGAVGALTVRYGQKHAREIEAARWNARRLGIAEHRVVDMAFFGGLTAAVSALTGRGAAVPDMAEIDAAQRDQPPTYVPNRNMTLLALAAAWAEARGGRDVFYAAQAQDRYGYWDCTPEFVQAVNGVLRLNRRDPVTVHAPYASLSKREVLKIGLEIGVDYAHTWTCYRGQESPCRTCPSCVERAAAFEAAGVRDPLLTAADNGPDCASGGER
ncbi:MAG: 7-cyano-7-deazaguanine synthase QueC [Lentisphaerae bacterium]|nr:7-cyano-7-deazaguanine synthase QueC [Lentisphaerota bacterium]